MKIQVPVLIIVTIILSCSGKKIKLSKEDFKWMPYSGNDTLIFTSNFGDSDTVYLFRKEKMTGYFEPQTSTDSYETVAVWERHLYTDTSDGQSRNLVGKFCSIKKNAKGNTELEITLFAKDAVFYRLSTIELDSMIKVRAISFKTHTRQFDDVYLINGEDYSGDFKSRSNFITRVYWSRTVGLIRYEKKNGVFWELSKN